MNKFSQKLNEVLKEYDGTEMFSEENALRLKKAFEKKMIVKYYLWFV